MRPSTKILESAISCWAKDIPEGHPLAGLSALHAWAELEPLWLARPPVSQLLDDLKSSSYDMNDHVLLLGDLLGALGDIIVFADWSPPPTLVKCVIARRSTQILDCAPLAVPEEAAAHLIERILVRLRSCAETFPGSPSELLHFIGINADEWSLLANAWSQTGIGSEWRTSAAMDELGVDQVIDVDSKDSEQAIRYFATSGEALPLRAMIRRISSTAQPAEQWLRSFHDQNENSAEAALALGTYLAMCNRWNEAITFLDRADDLSDGTNVFARVMYVVTAKTLGVSPARGLDEVLQRRLADWANPFGAGPDEVVDLHLIAWGSLTEGQVAAPLDVATKEQFLRRLDEVRIGQEQIHTEVIAQGRRVERALERDGFWIQRLAALLPAERRGAVESDLSAALRDWKRLPPLCKDHMLVARYLDDDPGLSAAEAAPAVVRSICLAVEVLARLRLELGLGADLGDVCARVEDIDFGTTDFRQRLRDLKALRNRATHRPGGLTRAEVTRAWSIALGTRGEPGCMDVFSASLP